MNLFPVHLIIFLVFINRYLFGLFLRKQRWRLFDERDDSFEPHVTIITPMYNEGKDIVATVQTLVAQDYPKEKLSVIVVDDCSTDDSYTWACRAKEGHDNVTVLKNPKNMGKRLSINRAVRLAESPIIVSVDSDVVLEPDSIRALVRRFTSPEIAAVGGRVLVRNANENWLTRMQTIKYFFGYEYMKNLERAYRTVMCLSGCLTAYRRHVLLELEPILEKRAIFGMPIKYGEDRFLTRQIVKAGYRTVLTLDSICYTTAPSKLTKYFSQQLRWRRSNIVDFLGGFSHAWKLPPIVGLHYVSLFVMMIAYPVIIIDNIMLGYFFELLLVHFLVLGGMAVLYGVKSRWMADQYRVDPIWFLSMGIVMPVTYVLLTPLAVLTLDSGSWETRGHSVPSEPEEESQQAEDGIQTPNPSQVA